MFELAKHYNGVDRKGPKIFVGEWATREGSPTPNMGAALGDAAFMTGLERNSDLVLMAAYAPLFVNVNPGGMQWSTDLIGYDALNSYGSPAYYAEAMFSFLSRRPHYVVQFFKGRGEVLYSVTATSNAKACLTPVNASSTVQPVAILLKGLRGGTHPATMDTFQANTASDTNSIVEPNRIVPVRAKVRAVDFPRLPLIAFNRAIHFALYATCE